MAGGFQCSDYLPDGRYAHQHPTRLVEGAYAYHRWFYGYRLIKCF